MHTHTCTHTHTHTHTHIYTHTCTHTHTHTHIRTHTHALAHALYEETRPVHMYLVLSLRSCSLSELQHPDSHSVLVPHAQTSALLGLRQTPLVTIIFLALDLLVLCILIYYIPTCMTEQLPINSASIIVHNIVQSSLPIII